ncbi:acyltransferase [Methanobrevibacter sp.]|uniref:acyltransferase n=1 Tax=Methanobrevibacter sp. TaxID=66852 RepID=UPI00388DDEE6
MNIVKSQRDYAIDLLRIVSMLMVPMVHILGQGGILAAAVPFSIQYESAWLLESFLLVAVNCFVLITGYVYYGKETKYYHLLTLWAEVLFYSIIIIIALKFMVPNEIGLEHYWKSIIPTFFTKGQFSRYWFFSAYVGMFLLSPFVNLGLKHFDKKQDLTVFLTLFIIFSLLPTILNQDQALNLNQGYSILWFVVLYYTGGIIHKYEIFKKFKTYKWALIYIVCMLLSWAIRFVLESVGLIEPGFALYSFNCYSSALYFVGGIALFCVFKNINITKSSVISVIKFFTPVCFGVYLIHNNMSLAHFYFDGRFEFLASMDPISLVIGVILIGLGIFVACSLVDWVRELLFRALKVKSRLAKFEKNVYSKFNNYLNLNS